MNKKAPDTVNAKLADLDTPGAAIEMTREEAELAGAFVEDALTLEDVLEASTGEGGSRAGTEPGT